MNTRELAAFLLDEHSSWHKHVGSPLPPIDDRVVELTDSPLLQRYCSTRLFYYGGGDSAGCKIQSCRLWMIEALVNPQPLN